jgi:hypothetical protein
MAVKANATTTNDQEPEARVRRNWFDTPLMQSSLAACIVASRNFPRADEKCHVNWGWLSKRQ